jgi:hypothetical protein
MADDAREYVRAAQAAELRKDTFTAVEMLIKAAAVYRSTGRPSRALGMLRHALRLDGSRVDVQTQIERLEWFPEQPAGELEQGGHSLASEMEKILQPLQEFVSAPEVSESPGGDPARLVERGPTLADPAAEAWCSFCCNPARDVGPLVAGPAGAFVCGKCVGLAATLTGSREGLGAVSSVAPVAVPVGGLWPSQQEALRALERNLRWGRRRILVLGPVGAGKSLVLGRLAEAIGGDVRQVGTPGRTGEGPLLLDGLEAAEAAVLATLTRRLAAQDGVVVLTARGALPEGLPAAVTAEGRALLPTTAALQAALLEPLPPALLESFDGVVQLEAPQLPLLTALAESGLGALGVPAAVMGLLARHFAEAALASGRGAHEVVAQVRRVPPGTRAIDPVPAAGAGTGAARRSSRSRKPKGSS